MGRQSKTGTRSKENWDGVKCASYCEVAEFCPLGKFLKKEREDEEMAIKGVSEVRRLPRCGKIRLGIKKKTKEGVEYPAEVDYFILDRQVFAWAQDCPGAREVREVTVVPRNQVF